MNESERQSYQEFVSLPARVAGVVRSPKALLAAVIDRPRWASVIALSFAVTAGCGMAFLETAVGRQALVDQWERTALAFGQEVDDERYDQFVQLSERGAAYAVLSAAAGGPALTLGMAALLFTVFTGMLGGAATFQQVLAVAGHAGVILAVRQVVTTPLNYLRETLASPATLGLFFPMFDEASPPARFLGVVDLFVVWWVIVLALGVALLYRRPARATVTAFVSIYVGVAAAMALAMAVTGGTV